MILACWSTEPVVRGSNPLGRAGIGVGGIRKVLRCFGFAGVQLTRPRFLLSACPQQCIVEDMEMQPERLIEVFSENVRRLRLEKELTQEQLALLLNSGVAASYVSDVERGKKGPTLRMVAVFSQALRVNPSELVTPVATAALADS